MPDTEQAIIDTDHELTQAYNEVQAALRAKEWTAPAAEVPRNHQHVINRACRNCANRRAQQAEPRTVSIWFTGSAACLVLVDVHTVYTVNSADFWQFEQVNGEVTQIARAEILRTHTSGPPSLEKF